MPAAVPCYNSRMTGRDKWDILALLAFAAVFALAGYALISTTGWLVLLSLEPFEFVLISLAAFRLLHLITYDKVLAFVRNYFDRRGKQEGANGGFRYVDSFLECLWCTGVWSGLIVLTVYCLGIWGQFLVVVLAVSGVASLLQLASHAFARRID